ncbi:hypothetical protein [Sphingobacterium suaedae]|uniref:Universal stress protein n=1 Tax=Sphingobacterium suaedae TaxID=1686402 RepID=A0ABW5KJ88_9SPHI
MAGIQRVLIPTDFTVNSLRIALAYLEDNGEQPVELVFVCGYNLGDSITSLLGFTKDDQLNRLQGEDFVKGCQMIKSRFEHKVVELYSDLFISKNPRYLRNCIKGGKVTHVVLPENFMFRFSNKQCFDVAKLLKTMKGEGRVTMVGIGVGSVDLESADTMDGIFFRKDWRISYE